MKILNVVGSRKRTLIKRKSCRKWLTLITTSEIQSFNYSTLMLNLVCALSVRESYHLPHYYIHCARSKGRKTQHLNCHPAHTHFKILVKAQTEMIRGK